MIILNDTKNFDNHYLVKEFLAELLGRKTIGGVTSSPLALQPNSSMPTTLSA